MTKHEFGTEKPKNLQEEWPGQYTVFSWLEYVVNIPYPIFIITTYKANGKANANLWAWGFFTGEETRIKECPISLECKFEWEKSLFYANPTEQLLPLPITDI